MTYKIIRYSFKGGQETIRRGLTLAEAQEWTQREDTRGGLGDNFWFDGYKEEGA